MPAAHRHGNRGSLRQVLGSSDKHHYSRVPRWKSFHKRAPADAAPREAPANGMSNAYPSHIKLAPIGNTIARASLKFTPEVITIPSAKPVSPSSR